MARGKRSTRFTPPACESGFVGGARYAIAMLGALESNKALNASCEPEARYRDGVPLYNIVMRFLEVAQATGDPRTVEGFCQVLTAFTGITTAGCVPDASYLATYVDQWERAEAAGADKAFRAFLATATVRSERVARS